MYPNLTNIRKQKQITIKEMAHIIGKSPANYYKKENGSVTMTVEEAMVIANFFHESVEVLFAHQADSHFLK